MGKGSKPKDPAKPSAPATETDLDIQQEEEAVKKKAKKRAGTASTVLTEQTADSQQGTNTVLG